jgi:hypothetical protein
VEIPHLVVLTYEFVELSIGDDAGNSSDTIRKGVFGFEGGLFLLWAACTLVFDGKHLD